MMLNKMRKIMDVTLVVTCLYMQVLLLHDVYVTLFNGSDRNEMCGLQKIYTHRSPSMQYLRRKYYF